MMSPARMYHCAENEHRRRVEQLPKIIAAAKEQIMREELAKIAAEVAVANINFVIDPKYDAGVGFIGIDKTRQLVRHYETDSYACYITLDVYEDGLIMCHKKSFCVVGSGNGSYGYFCKDNPNNIITVLFTIELTNGEKINETILELIDNIYSPLCEKTEPTQTPNFLTTYFYKNTGTYPNGICYCPITQSNYRALIICEIYAKTFETLQILKKLCDKIVIF